MVIHSRNGSNDGSQEPRHILVVCRSEMIAASLTELLARSGYGVTGVVNADRGRKVIEARPIALVVLSSRGDGGDIELVRAARLHGVPTIVVALSPGKPGNFIVDGQSVIGASNGALLAAVKATIGGPVDAGPTDPSPRDA